MPYARSQGLRLHYQVEGDGPPLVCQHGFGDSVESWYELGYVDALKDDYRLILIDARGHGASDKPHEPEVYSFQNVTADVVAVLTLGYRLCLKNMVEWCDWALDSEGLPGLGRGEGDAQAGKERM
jgi:pimeloyl-ACP methyl ester carboxylesterase